MPRPRHKVAELVELIRQHGPISPNALTKLTGDWRQSVDWYIRQAREADLIHIGGYELDTSRGENRTVKLYVFGPGVDAVRPKQPKKAYQRPLKGTPMSVAVVQAREKRARRTVDVHRDPLVAALFGACAPLTNSRWNSRVYRQPMSVNDEEGVTT